MEFNLVGFTEKDGAIIFNVRVVPRASKSEIVGEHDGALKVRIAAPPVDGAANAELIRVLSKTFGAAKNGVQILSGQTSKNKQICVSNISGKILTAILQAKNQRDIFKLFSLNQSNKGKS